MHYQSVAVGGVIHYIKMLYVITVTSHNSDWIRCEHSRVEKPKDERDRKTIRLRDNETVAE